MDILISYFHHEKKYKVSTGSMIGYKGRKYSVPTKYGYLIIFFTTKMIMQKKY